MKYELKSDEDKVIGSLEVDKDFDENDFLYFETEDLRIELNFTYKCNKC